MQIQKCGLENFLPPSPIKSIKKRCYKSSPNRVECYEKIFSQKIWNIIGGVRVLEFCPNLYYYIGEIKPAHCDFSDYILWHLLPAHNFALILQPLKIESTDISLPIIQKFDHKFGVLCFLQYHYIAKNVVCFIGFHRRMNVQLKQFQFDNGRCNIGSPPLQKF